MTGKSNPSFELLDSRLRGYIANRLRWKSLTPIQNQSIPSIKEGNDTLVISPTASGKTEAVLMPILDDIIRNNLEPLSVIYVSPLKALINDMYDRIDKWCDYFNLEVTKWHGDVTHSKKSAFLKNPTDFLLITPESLEVIFMNKTDEQKRKIFENLKYMIVDEIHYFVESDRGTQLNSLLNRIEKYTDGSVTRVGLSATVGNPDLVLDWLKSGENAKIVKDSSSRSAQYKVLCGSDSNVYNVLKKYKDKKILIFVHSRREAERYYNFLKRKLKLKNIFIHHSSIDKERREESEEKFKYQENGFMISTSTLELGIDIGNIDIVVQIRPPANVSSFLQRMGRSGRRSKNQRSILFYIRDEDIFIALSDISLAKEGIIEDIKLPERPKDIYFHQILSIIFEYGKIKSSDLFNNLKNSYVFSKITQEEFRSILQDMEEKDFINIKDGHLSLGYTFEKKFGKRNFLDFYSVFCPNYEFKVRHGVKNIGMLDLLFVVQFLKKGSQFILGGTPWMVEDIDHKRFTIKVKKPPKKEGDIPRWVSEGGVMDYLITRKIYDILLGNHGSIGCFDELAQEKIAEYKEKAIKSGFREKIIAVEFVSKESKVYLYTFAGLRVNSLISTIFGIYHDIYAIEDSPYYSSFKFKNSLNFDDICDIMYDMENIFKKPEIYELIEQRTQKFMKNKFINHLPYEDQVTLKMDLLYNKKDLLRLTRENSLELISSSPFKDWK